MVKERLEGAAEAPANKWLAKHQAAIANLQDERKDAYREISELSAEPFDVLLARPNSWLQPTFAKLPDGKEAPLPTYDKHLLCDQDGRFPAELNEWEKRVLATEQDKDGHIAWYRNPARASQDSLGIVYEYSEDDEIMRPDFVFFSLNEAGEVVTDIVDPHGDHLEDALPKLRGLASHAEHHGALFDRIEAVAKVDGVYHSLNLEKRAVREMVRSVERAKSAYVDDGLATDY